MQSVSNDWVREARASIRDSPTDFFAVSQSRYWIDLILATTCAYVSAGIYLSVPLFSWFQFVTFPFAVFWLYRANSLVHEVCHLNDKELTSYKVGWNLLLGIPTLFPSTFFTSHHRDHHSGRHYGTSKDPEYVINMFTPGSLASMGIYLLSIMVYPLFALFRFLLAPISFLRPSWREFTLRRLSSFTLNWMYERNVGRIDTKVFVTVELLCFLRAWLIPLGVVLGVTHWTRLPLMYLLAISIVFCNQMRFLGDHHFEGDGDKMSLADHISDSCNYSRQDILTWLFNPFAIRFHALHHLFPSMPYHNLSAAHEHLTRTLPPSSPYHALDRPGWWDTAQTTLRVTRKAA